MILGLKRNIFVAKNYSNLKFKVKMNLEVIGTWAGAVWTSLNSADNTTLTMKALKKATKLKEKEVFAALGWLGREGKVAIAETEKDVTITLVG